MPDPFHKRFNIDVPIEEARRRFINRIENRVRTVIRELHSFGADRRTNLLEPLMVEIETALGEQHTTYVHHTYGFIGVWRERVGEDFSRCLRAVEGLSKAFSNLFKGHPCRKKFHEAVNETLNESEADLGVKWQDGFFSKKGAEILDENLVNESLRWLADEKYRNVLGPFQKGLSHLLEGTKDPQRYGDAVTDMYEALEAMAKIVTGKPTKDLSGLREEFIVKLRLPPTHKEMLKQYIDYGCEFRHALETGQRRAWPVEHEAENFVYLTGLFIRLAIQSDNS